MRAILTAAAAAFFIAAPAASAQSISLLRDAEIEEVLRDFTNPLLEAANLRPEDTHLYLVGDRSINAFVAGGQNIFMNTGTILEANTPNELKGVIAHEIGHIAGGHLTRSRQAQGAAVGSMLATMGLGLLAAVAGAPDAGAMIMAGSQQIGMGTFVRHTLVQESAADQSGIAYLEATGQSGRGLLAFFDKLRMHEVMRDRRTGSMYGDFLRSHPTSADRIARLRQRVNASPYRDVMDPEEDQHALEMIQAKIVGFLESPNRVLRRYPDSDQSKQARYARSVAHFRNGVLPRALTEIDSLIGEEPENPYFHELKGQILFESGRRDEAVPPYREAVRLKPDNALLRTGLGQALVSANDPEMDEEALHELRRATVLERDLSMAWYQLSLIYERQGNRPMAELAVAEQSYAMGDYIRARAFAQRAREGLEDSGGDWRRAADILSVSEHPAREQEDRMRRQRISGAHIH